MTKRTIRNIIIFCCLLITARLQAQDFQLSQYHAAPLFLNPASAGLFDGQYRFHLHTRSQWASTMTKSYQTNLISFDMPSTVDRNSNRLSFGAMIMNNRAGAGNFNILNFMLSGAYHYKLPASDDHNIAVGLQAGFMDKHINPDKFFFNSQYDPTSSGNINTGIESGEIFDATNVFQLDLNAGLIYFYSGSKRYHPFAGASIYHIIPPNESFYDETNKLPRRFVYNAGSKFFLNRQTAGIVQVLIMHQGNAKEIVPDLSVQHKLAGRKDYLLVGIASRIKDSYIVHMGYKYDQYTAQLSYDINTSGLSSYSRSRGGIEFSFTYEMKKKPVIPIPEICPVL